MLIKIRVIIFFVFKFVYKILERWKKKHLLSKLADYNSSNFIYVTHNEHFFKIFKKYLKLLLQNFSKSNEQWIMHKMFTNELRKSLPCSSSIRFWRSWAHWSKVFVLFPAEELQRNFKSYLTLQKINLHQANSASNYNIVSLLVN